MRVPQHPSLPRPSLFLLYSLSLVSSLIPLTVSPQLPCFQAKGCLAKAEAHHKICQDKASTLTQTSERSPLSLSSRLMLQPSAGTH